MPCRRAPRGVEDGLRRDEHDVLWLQSNAAARQHDVPSGVGIPIQSPIWASDRRVPPTLKSAFGGDLHGDSQHALFVPMKIR